MLTRLWQDTICARGRQDHRQKDGDVTVSQCSMPYVHRQQQGIPGGEIPVSTSTATKGFY